MIVVLVQSSPSCYLRCVVVLCWLLQKRIKALFSRTFGSIYDSDSVRITAKLDVKRYHLGVPFLTFTMMNPIWVGLLLLTNKKA
jgi:hypothetical protein